MVTTNDIRERTEKLDLISSIINTVLSENQDVVEFLDNIKKTYRLSVLYIRYSYENIMTTLGENKELLPKLIDIYVTLQRELGTVLFDELVTEAKYLLNNSVLSNSGVIRAVEDIAPDNDIHLLDLTPETIDKILMEREHVCILLSHIYWRP